LALPAAAIMILLLSFAKALFGTAKAPKRAGDSDEPPAEEQCVEETPPTPTPAAAPADKKSKASRQLFPSADLSNRSPKDSFEPAAVAARVAEVVAQPAPAPSKAASSALSAVEEHVASKGKYPEEAAVPAATPGFCGTCGLATDNDAVICTGPCKQNFHLGCLSRAHATRYKNTTAWVCSSCTPNPSTLIRRQRSHSELELQI